MKKVYKMTDLCCANCAAEIERDIAKIKGVNECSVNFIMQKLTVEIDDDTDFDAVMKKVVKTCKKIEPDCRIIL